MRERGTDLIDRWLEGALLSEGRLGLRSQLLARALRALVRDQVVERGGSRMITPVHRGLVLELRVELRLCDLLRAQTPSEPPSPAAPHQQ